MHPILPVLTLASDRKILNGNVAFSILVLQLKKFSFFQKVCFKVKVLKPFIISSDCHKKHVHLSNGALFLKSLVPFSRRTYALSVGFKMKPLSKKAFSCVKTKTSSNFAVKLVERSNRLFSVYLRNHFFQTSLLFNI